MRSSGAASGVAGSHGVPGPQPQQERVGIAAAAVELHREVELPFLRGQEEPFDGGRVLRVPGGTPSANGRTITSSSALWVAATRAS